MIYLDANVFLTAFLRADKPGEDARAILNRIQRGEKTAATSSLTYDEFFWVVKKYRGFDAALRASKTLLEMPNLSILPVGVDEILFAHGLIEKYELAPRDAIHAACALTNGVHTMISDDRDFDKVKELARKEAWPRKNPNAKC